MGPEAEREQEGMRGDVSTGPGTWQGLILFGLGARIPGEEFVTGENLKLGQVQRVLPAGQAYYIRLLLDSPGQVCGPRPTAQQKPGLRECECLGQGATLLTPC